jgi:hypothetical protein
VEGTKLTRVVNTRVLLLKDSKDKFYLHLLDGYMEASALAGPWSLAKKPPKDAAKAEAAARELRQVDLLEGSEPDGRPPRVIVSTAPTELIQSDGPPQYAPIERTQLLYVTNSPNRLFLELPTQQYYVLLAGRWYRTRSLQQGPWEYVPGTGLPADFALIPDTHPTETVRAAVPGTPQAQEAVIVNSVPQVATVKRSAARLEFGYDGPPQFRPIEGTALESAVNAPVPVIRVDASTYYALQSGVWFVAPAPAGPAFEGAQIRCGMRAADGAIEVVKIVDDEVVLQVIGDVAPQGLCGSGLVDAVAVLVDVGLLDGSGRFIAEDAARERLPSLAPRLGDINGERVFALHWQDEPGDFKDSIYLSQRDVRELQFAKAAIATGWHLLVEEMGVDVADIQQVLLAGSFGSYLSPASAVRIGLVPKIPVLRIVSAGNVAGEGAKMTLLSSRERVGAQTLLEEVTYVELSDRPDFNDRFIDLLAFPG